VKFKKFSVTMHKTFETTFTEIIQSRRPWIAKNIYGARYKICTE